MLLPQDPQQRISLQAVQQHPWFLAADLPPDCQVRAGGQGGGRWGTLMGTGWRK